MTASSPRRLFAMLVLLMAIPVARAQVYKCPTAGGGATYQDKPCAGAPKAAPYIAATAVPAPTDPAAAIASADTMLTRMDLRELAEARRKNEQAWAQWQSEAVALKHTLEAERYRANADQQTKLAELELRLEVLKHAGQAIANELRRRCPKGVVRSGEELSCRSQ